MRRPSLSRLSPFWQKASVLFFAFAMGVAVDRLVILVSPLVYRVVNMAEITQGFLINFHLYGQSIITCLIASLLVGLLAGGWPAMPRGPGGRCGSIPIRCRLPGRATRAGARM